MKIYFINHAATAIIIITIIPIIIFSWMHMPCFFLHPSIEHISDI